MTQAPHANLTPARDRIEATILLADRGRVPPRAILDTKLFDFERAALAPGWMKEMRGEHVPETEEYGVSSFVYRARRPFHPGRFWELLHSGWDGVLRSKGFFAREPHGRDGKLVACGRLRLRGVRRHLVRGAPQERLAR